MEFSITVKMENKNFVNNGNNLSMMLFKLVWYQNKYCSGTGIESKVSKIKLYEKIPACRTFDY